MHWLNTPGNHPQISARQFNRKVPVFQPGPLLYLSRPLALRAMAGRSAPPHAATRLA